jgi:hypothetical protein
LTYQEGLHRKNNDSKGENNQITGASRRGNCETKHFTRARGGAHVRTITTINGVLTSIIHSKVLLITMLAVELTVSAQTAFQVPVNGEIMSITLDNPADVYSAGTIVVGRHI